MRREAVLTHGVVHADELKLVCDDFAGYKAGFELGVTEIGCMTHARRKFFDLHATNKSQIAEKALHYIAALYEVEREVRELEAESISKVCRSGRAAPNNTFSMATADSSPPCSWQRTFRKS
jgi:hypothetical protein